MADKRVVTKVEYDTTGVREGLDAGKAALGSFDEKVKETARTSDRANDALQRSYERLVGAIDPADKAQQRYARAVEITDQMVKRGRITQEQANETLAKANTFYGAQAAQINNLGDLFDKVGGKTAILAGKAFAIVGSFKAGWEMGQQFRTFLNEWTDNDFDRYIQKWTGMNAVLERFAGVTSEAGQAATRYRNNLNILMKSGVDTTGLSQQQIDEAAFKVMRERGQLSAKLATEEKKVAEERERQLKREGEERARLARQQAEEARRVAEQFRNLRAEQGENLRTQRELLELWQNPNLGLDTRAKEEQRINDEHQDRLEFLKLERQFGAERARQLVAEAAQLRQITREVKERADAEKAAFEAVLARARAGGVNVESLPVSRPFGGQSTVEVIEPPQRSIEEWQQFGATIRAGFRTAREDAEDYIAQVRAATQETGSMSAESALSVADAEREIARVRSEITQQQIQGALAYASAWTNLFSTLSDLFGGFGAEAVSTMEKIVGAIQQVNSAVQQINSTGQSMQSLFGGGGGGGGMFSGLFGGGGGFGSAASTGVYGPTQSGGNIAGSWASGSGWAGSAVGIGAFLAAVAFGQNQSRTRGRPEVDTTIAFGGPEGIGIDSGLTGSNRQGRARLEGQLRAMREMVESVGDFITDLGGYLDTSGLDASSTLTLGREGQGRNTNWFVRYADGLVRHFGQDAQAAMDFAMVQALRETPALGLSPEVRQALSASTAETMSELQEDLDVALTAVRARIGEAGSQVMEIWRDWDQVIRRQEELGIAIDHSIAARDREIDAFRNQALGIDTSISDMIASLRSLDAGFEESTRARRSQIEQQIADARRSIAALRGIPDGGVPGGGGGAGGEGSGGGGFDIDFKNQYDAQIRELQEQIDRWLEELGRIPQGLSDQELDRGIFRALFQDLEGTGQFMEQARRYAREEVEIRYALIQTELELAGKWEQFADMFNAARENALRNADRSVRRGAGGGGQREGVRDWLDDNAFRLAAERMGELERELAQMNRTYDEQAEQVKKGSAEMARLNAQRREEADLIRQRGISAGYDALREFEGSENPFDAQRQRADEIRKGFDDLLKAGAIGVDRHGRALARTNAALERQLELLGQQESANLFGSLAGLLGQAGLGETKQALDLIAAQQRLNFILQRQEARDRFNQLVAEGRLVGEAKRLAEEALGIIEGKNPGDLFGPPKPEDTRRFIASGVSKAEGAANPNDALLKAREDAMRLREKYSEEQDPFRRQLEEIKTDFDEIFKALGRGQENLDLFRRAVDDAFSELKKPVQEWLEGFGLSENSSLTQQQRYDLALQQANETFSRLKGGDFSAYEDLTGSLDTALELARGQFGTAGSAYQKLEAELKAMAQQALLLADAASANFTATGKLGFGNVSPLPLAASTPVVQAVEAAAAIAKASDKKLASIEAFSQSQAQLIGLMSLDIAALRASQESLTRQLSMQGNMR